MTAGGTVPDPRAARPRPDLTWMRRRHLPAAANPQPAAGSPLADYIRSHSAGGTARRAPAPPIGSATEPLRGPATEPSRGPAAEPSRGSAAQPSRGSAAQPSRGPAAQPSRGPAAEPPRRPPATPPARSTAPVSSSLNLDDLPIVRAGRPAPTSTSGSTSLDLDEPTAVPAAPNVAAPPPTRATPAPSAPRVRQQPRLAPGARTLLTPTDPTVTLTRVQSGIGAVTVELAVGSGAAPLELGCLYELADGTSSTVHLRQGERTAPASSRRPVIVAGRERFEHLGIDARQCREIRRVVVYALPAAGAPPAWSGTAILSTYGGSRAEVPLDSLQSGDVAVLLSIYQVHGEFVVRAEMQPLFGRVREAARAYGFARITWLDPNTPLR